MIYPKQYTSKWQSLWLSGEKIALDTFLLAIPNINCVEDRFLYHQK